MTRTIRALSVAVAAAITLAGAPSVRAQGLSPSAEALYADASAKESAVRKALAGATPPITVLKAVRTVVLDFEAVARRYPGNPYSDDALWRGALLSSDAFRAFGDPHEQQSATRLLHALSSQFPDSKLARQGPALIAELSVLPTRASVSFEPTRPAEIAKPASTSAAITSTAASKTTVPPPAAPVPSASVAGASSVKTPLAAVTTATTSTAAVPARVAVARSAGNQVATIKDIRRVTMPDVVRVIIELDREVSFHDERLGNPNRVFLDLPGTATIRELRDQTIRFDGDNDLVRQVRLGRHPNNTTRIVLEADAVSSYSVYALYNPFRLVIDCLRETPRATHSPTAVATTGTPSPVTPAALPPFPMAPRIPGLVWLTARRVEPWSRATPRLSSASPVINEALAEPLPAPPVAAPVTTATVASLPLTPVIEAPSRMLAGGLSLARQLGLGVSRIVIDPGHGGHDPGAKGGGTNEADLVLDVALRLEKLFQSSPDMEVILTRRTNDYVTLQERTAIANREGADLFLSIHANASNASNARGFETYFLNFANNLSAAATAARENAAAGQPMGELPDVVRTIALNNKLQESKDFATYVQREMVTRLGGPNRSTRDHGVKQAPFQVLIGAAMPSVLAEIAFLTNTQEARLVKQSAYRQRVAEALFNAVRKYQGSFARVSTAKANQ